MFRESIESIVGNIESIRVPRSGKLRLSYYLYIYTYIIVHSSRMSGNFAACMRAFDLEERCSSLSLTDPFLGKLFV